MRFLDHSRSGSRKSERNGAGREVQDSISEDRALSSKVVEDAEGDVVGSAGGLSLLEVVRVGGNGGQGPGEDGSEAHVEDLMVGWRERTVV